MRVLKTYYIIYLFFITSEIKNEICTSSICKIYIRFYFLSKYLLQLLPNSRRFLQSNLTNRLLPFPFRLSGFLQP